jgi:cyclic dehypoxanthinyl futalosine synthase
MLKEIYQKIENNQRITPDDAKALFEQADFLTLGKLAKQVALEKNGPKAAFLIDRNINYTNACTARCSFCAFYRPPKHKDVYDLSFEEIDQKISETLHMGGTRVLLQGGLHPEHTLETYEKMISHLKKTHPSLHIHAFSPPEIYHVATNAGISYREVLQRLKDAGLKTIPGGGAEILVDEVRDQLIEGKCHADEWLEIMEEAHKLGIRSTATMMLGHIETIDHRIEHLRRLREVQDRTEGFLSFIPWSFQPENTPLHPKIKKNKNVKLASGFEYLRFLAVSRIFLDNFDHIQVSLLTQGTKIAQIGLHYGADDLGSLLIEENVVRMAGKPQEIDLEKSKMIQIIEEAGLEAYERDTYYNPVGMNEKSNHAFVKSPQDTSVQV